MVNSNGQCGFYHRHFPSRLGKTVWKQIDEVRMDQSQEYLGNILSITNLQD